MASKIRIYKMSDSAVCTECVEDLFLKEIIADNGDHAFFEECCSYVPKRVSAHEVLDEWQSVQDELRHSRRFFSETAKSFFASIFNEIDTLRAPSKGESGPVQVVRLLPAGSEIYRARTCNSSTTLKDIHSDPYLHAGPPPPEQARAGRMNAEGVTVLYGGLDIDTAISELRPPLGGDTMVITLVTKQELRLLDF